MASGALVETNGISVSNVDFLDGINTTGGTITNSSATAATLTITSGSSTSGTLTYSGVVSGNLNLTRNVTTASTLVQTLFGTNTYTGNTTISGGNLKLGASNTLPVTTPLIVNGAAAAAASRLDLGGFNQTVASLAGTVTTGSASIINDTAATTSTLTVGGSTSTSYAGLLADNTGVGGTRALTWAGTGILTLTGANTYTGPTTISGGTLVVAPTTLGATAVSVASSETFAVNLAANGTMNTPTITVGAGGTFDVRQTVAGTALTAPSVSLSAAGSGNVQISTAALGNPTTAPLIATTFTPVAGAKVSLAGNALTWRITSRSSTTPAASAAMVLPALGWSCPRASSAPS